MKKGNILKGLEKHEGLRLLGEGKSLRQKPTKVCGFLSPTKKLAKDLGRLEDNAKHIREIHVRDIHGPIISAHVCL